jgi:DNA (cytosine-5)-methyltransferase 1
VFLVAGPRDGFRAEQVLFEFDGLRRDTPPSREAGEGTAQGFETGPSGGGFTELAPTLDTRCKDGPIRNQLGCGVISAPVIAGALEAQYGQRNNPAHENWVTQEIYPTLDANMDRKWGSNQWVNNGFALIEPMPETTHTLRADGFDASEDGTGRGTPLIPCLPLPFDTTQITSKANRSQPQAGDPCHPLASGAHPPAIAFPERLSGTQYASTEDLSPSLQILNPTAVAFSARARGDDGRGYDRPEHVYGDIAGSLDTMKPHNVALSSPAYAVRRLTPRECERLQGFPDDYTLIPWRNKPADLCPDGPRYKALGNSMAVPVMHWIGARLCAYLRE